MNADTISVTDLQEALDRGEQVTMLDVRIKADRSDWFIPGSRHLDVHDALWANQRTALEVFTAPAGTTVVTVCGRGRTSLLAAARLRERGIDARSLEGGMRAWSLAW